MATVKKIGVSFFVSVFLLSVFLYGRSSTASGGTKALDEGQTVDALLAEVHQLRLALQRSNLSTFRTQLILERLKLQTERVDNLRELVDRTREEMANAKYNRPRMIDRLKDLESEIPATRNEDDRKKLVTEQADLKIALEQLDAQVERQFEKENQLTAQLQVEQSRLDEINSRLDGMERDIQSQWPEDKPRQDVKRPD